MTTSTGFGQFHLEGLAVDEVGLVAPAGLRQGLAGDFDGGGGVDRIDVPGARLQAQQAEHGRTTADVGHAVARLHHLRHGGSELLKPDGIRHIAQMLVEHATQEVVFPLDSMNAALHDVDAQQRVIDHLVAIGVQNDCLRKHHFDLVSHDAELPSETSRFTVRRLVIEQVEPETCGVGADTEDVLLQGAVGSPPHA